MLQAIFYKVKRKCLRLIYGNRLGMVAPEASQGQPDWFKGHYNEWRQKRVEYLFKHCGSDYTGKTVLELGCGYGDIGEEFLNRGAEVTFADARITHLEEVNRRHRGSGRKFHTVLCDLDVGFPEGRFDLVLHLGVLYHLRSPAESIRLACAATNLLILETEVADSSDPNYEIQIREEGYDQAFGKFGTRPSGPYVERILRECGFGVEMLATADCNSGIHDYDWKVEDTGTWKPGHRRLWVCTRL